MVILPKHFPSIFSKNVAFFPKRLLDEKIFKTSFSIKKGNIHFRRRTPFPFKIDLVTRNSFLPFSQKIQLFLKKLLSNTILHTAFVIKSYLNFGGKTPPFPKKSSNVPRKQFFVIFSENTTFFKRIVE